jgi:hypothetical protein
MGLVPLSFEQLYQRWLQGRFDRRTLDEDVEREYRQLERHQPKLCIHGKTRLTCSTCWFHNYGD